MPTITPGNSLYLYRLFSQHVGVGKQTMLAKMEETLAEDDIFPSDLGCADVRELLDKLSFVKLTVFKRGRVYATVMPQPEWDELLERANTAEKKSGGGGGPKSWKRKKAGKDLRPERPRPHGRPTANAADKSKDAETTTAPAVVKHNKQASKMSQDGLMKRRGNNNTSQDASEEQQANPTAQQAGTDAPQTSSKQQKTIINVPQDESATQHPLENAPQTIVKEPQATHEKQQGFSEHPQIASDGLPGIPRKALAADALAEADALAPITLEQSPRQSAGKPATNQEGAASSRRQAQKPDIALNTTSSAESAAAAKTMATKGEPADTTFKTTAQSDSIATNQSRGNADDTPTTPSASPSAPEFPASPERTSTQEKPLRGGAARPQPPVQLERSSAPQPARPPVPSNFAREVWCPSNLLSSLYELLPLDINPVELLSEDWNFARSTEDYALTERGVSFALRCLCVPSSTSTTNARSAQTAPASTTPASAARTGVAPANAMPVRATLHRQAPTASGKRWKLASIDGPLETAFVDFNGLPAKDEGAWSDLTGSPHGTYYRTTPAREFAAFATLGPWQSLLSQLAAIAQPEQWGDDYIYLREYLTVTYHRLAHEHKVVTSNDEQHASFDTGLLTSDARRIFANFTRQGGATKGSSANEGTPAWRLTGFSITSAVTPEPEPATYVTELRDLMLAAPYTVRLHASLKRRNERRLSRAIEQAVTRARRNHRMATPAYDPQAEKIRLLLPLSLGKPGVIDRALVLAPLGEGSYEARALVPLERARTCARVVTSDLPRWLA
ncbi:MAG: DUF3825 domain-containing protein [Atopobiaceae bacterium]|nr:DUF3825 domain-containing protein [Atopobiaceae bacterium]